MRPTEKSCLVAFPKECNYATSAHQHATTSATATQPTSLKALAGKVLARNQRCNQDATWAQQGCNFSPENDPEKLHGFGGGISGAPPRPTLPRWCRSDCPGLETIPLAKEGDVAGCVNPVTGTWRRLDWLTECPAIEKATRPALPEWCSTTCQNYHKADAEYCCREEGENHWRRDRLKRTGRGGQNCFGNLPVTGWPQKICVSISSREGGYSISNAAR